MSAMFTKIDNSTLINAAANSVAADASDLVKLQINHDHIGRVLAARHKLRLGDHSCNRINGEKIK